ncbi:phage tail protein [Falsiroseomonas sp. E2-1-a4]|uniref:phage tail protein n=1 Tax=Falsiroseomonas sp. E2-1-a4 TaxID=3239299 RepID=UPI003F36336C
MDRRPPRSRPRLCRAAPENHGRGLSRRPAQHRRPGRGRRHHPRPPYRCLRVVRQSRAVPGLVPHRALRLESLLGRHRHPGADGRHQHLRRADRHPRRPARAPLHGERPRLARRGQDRHHPQARRRHGRGYGGLRRAVLYPCGRARAALRHTHLGRPARRRHHPGSRPRRDLFNGVRAVYVDPAKNWQPTDAPPLLAANYVAEDGGEQIFRDLEFPLTTSVATVQRLMKAELERVRRQREVAFPANLSALRLRPWDGVTVALDRVGAFPARVTGWRLSPDGGVDLALSEEDPAVWNWNPAVDERAAGDSPSVVLPNPGIIAAPAAIAVATPVTAAFWALGVSWSPVGSAFLAGYELEFLPASVAVWQGYGGALGATAASVPTTEPTAFRARAVARSGAVSGWREAAVPGAVTAPAALGITGGVRLSGGVPIGAVRLQVFEADSASLATEPTALPWDRTGLTTGQARWYWLRSVSAEGNVSDFAGPVTATAL